MTPRAHSVSGTARKLLPLAFVCATLLSPALPTQTPAAFAEATTLMRSGLASAQRGDLRAARRDLERVVRLAPKIAPGHAALGWVLLTMGDLQPAEAQLQTALRLAPNDAASQLNLARCESALAHHTAAVDLFRKATAGPTPPTLNESEALAYATSLKATGHAAEALTLLQSVADQQPSSAALADAAGALLAASGQAEAALPYFERALKADPASPSAAYHRAATLLELGQTHAATEAAQALASRESTFDTELLLGRALSAERHDPEALTHLHRAAQLHPEQHPVDAQYALAVALQASGDSRASLPFFATAVDHLASLSIHDNSPLINYALARVQTGDADGALTLYARALAHGPDTATLREDYGAAFLQKADLDDATRQFRAGLALEPNSALLHYDLGLALKLQDDLTQAVLEFERAAALDPQLPDPAYTLGVIYMQQGRFDDAGASLRRAVTLQPANGDAWALLGGVLKDSDHPAEAADALTRAIALQPDQPSLHIQLAAIEQSQGKRDQAAAERKIAADLSRAATNRQRASFALRSGRALLEQGKLPEAILQLHTAADADPTLAEPHALLAQALERQGKAAESAVERERATHLGEATVTHH